MLRNRSFIRTAILLTFCISLSGCGSKDEKAPKKPEVVVLKAPPAAMVYGGTESISDVLAKVEKLGKTVVPNLPPLATMVGPLVQAEFRLTSSAALNMKAPLRFALFDPKVFGSDPSALLLGISSAEAFAQALPAVEKKQNDQGNAWSFKRFVGAKNGVYVNFIGSNVVLTGHPKIFESNKTFFSALLKEKLPADGVVYVEMDHVMKGFAKEIDAMTKNDQMAKDLLAKQGQPTQLVTTVLPWLLSARQTADDIKQLQGRLVFGTDGFKLDGRFLMKDGSKLAKTVAQMKGANHSFLERLPTDSPVVGSFDARPEAYSKLVKQLIEDILSAVAPEDKKAEIKPMIASLGEYLQGIDGKMAFAIHGDPSGSGLTSSMLLGIKDRSKVQRATKALSQISNSIQGWQLTGGMPGIPAPKTSYNENAYSVGGYDVSISKVGGSDPLMAAGPFADLGTSHFAISDTLAISSQGASAKQVITNHAQSQYKGLNNSPMIKRAFKGGATDAFALFTIAPVAVAKRVSLGGMNPLAMSLGNVPDDGSLSISVGKNEGAIQVVLDLPIKLIDQGMKAFNKVKGGL